jgi:hypothetical protein
MGGLFPSIGIWGFELIVVSWTGIIGMTKTIREEPHFSASDHYLIQFYKSLLHNNRLDLFWTLMEVLKDTKTNS